MLSRRHLLLAMGALAAPVRGAAVTYPDVVPRVLRFPKGTATREPTCTDERRCAGIL